MAKKIDFYSHFRPYKNGLFETIINKINEIILKFFKNKEVTLISGSKKLQKNILKIDKKDKTFFVIRNNNDFKLYHLAINFINLFIFKKKSFIIFQLIVKKNGHELNNFFDNFFQKIKTNEISFF